MKTRRRPDPYAFNPEKFLAAEEKKASSALISTAQAFTPKKHCELCHQRMATVHTPTGEHSGANEWSDLCLFCYELRYKSRAQGSCKYCGAPAEGPVGYDLAPSESPIEFRCTPCMVDQAAFFQRPENAARMEEHHQHTQKLLKTPFFREYMTDRKRMDEFLSRPENATLKAECDSQFQRTKKLQEDMETYVRECAAKRKQV
jgi:hypothetical protein